MSRPSRGASNRNQASLVVAPQFRKGHGPGMLLGGLGDAVMVAVSTETGVSAVTTMALLHASPATCAAAGNAAASPAQLAMMARSVGRKREIGVYVCMEWFSHTHTEILAGALGQIFRIFHSYW